MTRELPFVKHTDDTVDFWNVKPTGDYGQDFKTGRSYARQLIQEIASRDGIPAELTWTVEAMPEKRSGIEAGFFWEIAELAAAAIKSQPWLRLGELKGMK